MEKTFNLPLFGNNQNSFCQFPNFAKATPQNGYFIMPINASQQQFLPQMHQQVNFQQQGQQAKTIIYTVPDNNFNFQQQFNNNMNNNNNTFQNSVPQFMAYQQNNNNKSFMMPQMNCSQFIFSQPSSTCGHMSNDIKQENLFNIYKQSTQSTTEEHRSCSDADSVYLKKEDSLEIVQSFDTPKEAKKFGINENSSPNYKSTSESEFNDHSVTKSPEHIAPIPVKIHRKDLIKLQKKKIKKEKRPAVQKPKKQETQELLVEEPALFKFTKEFPDWPLHTIFEFLEESSQFVPKRSDRKVKPHESLIDKIDDDFSEDDNTEDSEDESDDYQPIVPNKRKRKNKVPYTGKRRGRPRKNPVLDQTENNNQ